MMNITPLLLLLLLITQQSAANDSGESFSQLVQLYHYAETQLNEVKTMFATQMENVALQQKKLSNDLRSQTTAYIDEELQKLESSDVDSDNPDKIKSKIYNCGVEVDNTIEVGIEYFVDILDTAEQMVYSVDDILRNEPSSDDIDEINDEVDDILDDVKEKFETTIIPLVDDLLRHLKKKLVSLPSDLRKCFDEIK